ncbi:trehalose-6-phosphatase [Herbaspirillum sp. Sphag1AN]|uniref:hypothetical protein n=1 Tax=unclassified Herbaspirillum TaxID=2624150 RepID=UPI00161CDCBE|nr:MULTISPECIES: hypothetical protein [unclassified Herbaspirillum]MBB3214889.1 trehalose-6-phosphatase [Herbaspirillum sp. Sphag1AN]MBB3248083.1 trehalose-6-phosphatase [Herbaspirillum sp. Sphag64]
MHTSERDIISNLPKKKAIAICNGDSSCVTTQTLFWTDTLERVASGMVDDTENAKNKAYLAQLVQAASDPNSEGARGRLESYLNALQVSQDMLSPYVGKTIVVNGQTQMGAGAAETYFSATDSQRQNKYINTNPITGEMPDPIALGKDERDAARISNFKALNGSATPDYTVEKFLASLGVGKAVSGLIGKWLGTEAAATTDGVSATTSSEAAGGTSLNYGKQVSGYGKTTITDGNGNTITTGLPATTNVGANGVTTVGSEIKLVDGFYQAEGSAFKFSEYYYNKL